MDNNKICRELGFPGKDALDIYRSLYAARAADYNVSESIFDRGDYFSEHVSLIPALYHSCIYQVLKPHLPAQIAAGNIQEKLRY